MAKPSVFEKNPREAIKAYLEANVLPVLRAQRQKLEETLSAEEQQQISALREQMQALRPRKEASGDTRREKPTEEQREARATRRTERSQLMAEATSIAQQHEATIADLTAEIEDQRQQWKDDIRAIIAESGEEQADDPEVDIRRRRRVYDTVSLDDPARFILLDPNAPPAEGNRESQLYPNPVNEASVLAYQLAKKGPVIISLYNDQGMPVKTLVYEIQDPGSYQVSMETSELAPGTYEYSFATAEKTETGRLVKL
ncbi:MAG: T9SS type A sorting domain-containing protein [Tunicatimonas sp.]